MIMNKQDHLMYNFRAGSQIAFRHFMKQHLHALTFHAYRLCRNKEVSEEIVADTFSKLWQRKDNFDNETSIKSFLYITTRNACLDYIRSAQQRTSSQSVELEEDLILQDIDPLTHLIHAELIQSLVNEINRLPQRQGDVFRMTYLDGFTTDEICTRLGITPNAVFVAKKKATAKLRKVFSERELFTCLIIIQLLYNERVLH